MGGEKAKNCNAHEIVIGETSATYSHHLLEEEMALILILEEAPPSFMRQEMLCYLIGRGKG